MSDGGPVAKQGEGHEGYHYDTDKWTCYDKLKLAFGLATGLLAFRCVFGILIFVYIAGVAFVGGACTSPGTAMFKAARFLFAVGCKLLSTTLACYVIEVTGRENIKWIGKPGRHPIIIPNHITYLEVFNMHWLTGGMSGVMSKAMMKTPGFKHVAKLLDVIVVDPKDADVKDKVRAGIMNFVENQPNAEGAHLYAHAFTMYPEGITGSQFGLYRFNTGAFVPGQPILPCVQRFPYSFFNPAWVSKSTISEGNYGFWQIVRYATQFTIPCQVKFLEIYEPNAQEIQDPLLYAKNVQNYMALQLDIHVTDTSYKILRDPDGPFLSVQQKQGAEKPLLQK